MRRRRKREPLAAIGRWQPATFDIAKLGGIETLVGLDHAGLGISFGSQSRSRHVKKDGTRTLRQNWCLHHLGSGHLICIIQAPIERVVAIADSIADVGDWSFLGLHGWKNSDPELPQRAMPLIASFKECSRAGSGQLEASAATISAGR